MKSTKITNLFAKKRRRKRKYKKERGNHPKRDGVDIDHTRKNQPKNNKININVIVEGNSIVLSSNDKLVSSSDKIGESVSKSEFGSKKEKNE